MDDKIDKIAEEALEFFELVTTEKETAKQIAIRTGYSLKTIYNRINQGREIIDQQIREIGSKYLAEIMYDYEKVKKAAWAAWEASVTRSGGDNNFLKTYMAVIDAQRKIFSIDAPAKAPVNEDGKAVLDKLILVFPSDEYQTKEIEFQNRNQKLLETKIIDSTEVPLTTEKNELKSDDTENQAPIV